MIPFSPPHIDQKIIDEVVDTLKSGWLTTGPKTKRFEKELTKYCGNKATLCLNSATAGLEIMLRWFGVKEGDEVIVPAYTYCATANVVMHCGAKVVFVDISEDFNINLNAVKKAITENTKVIMPVDYGGYPCDYDELNTLVNSADVKYLFNANCEVQKILGRILILSDAAHSIGATYKGNKTGVLTDVTVFSFHAVKNLTTAEGGAIALNLPEPFNNDEVYQELCIKTLHGQDKDTFDKIKSGNWRYDIIEPGYNMRMSDIFASIGLVQLTDYESQVLVRRKEIFYIYTSAFKEYNWAIIPEYINSEKETSYHLYALRIKGATEEQRDIIIAKIFEKQVSVNVHFVPVPMMSFYKSKGYDISNYPESYNHYKNVITLPVYFDLDDEKVATVIDAVVRSVEEVMGV